MLLFKKKMEQSKHLKNENYIILLHTNKKKKKKKTNSIKIK